MKRELKESIVNEGVHDPSIFKAIFLAGGAGSGKTYVAKNTTGGMGFKMVNSDTLFEKMLRDANIAMTQDNIASDEVQVIRNVAKKKTASRKKNYLDGRLGLIIDGTGKDYEKISRQVTELRNLGYECQMIFVNTTLEVALERNAKRERSVPEELASKMWKEVQSNLGRFQSLFGKKNFTIVDNSTYEGTDKIFAKVWKKVMHLSKSKITNPIAKEWIKKELAKRRR